MDKMVVYFLKKYLLKFVNDCEFILYGILEIIELIVILFVFLMKMIFCFFLFSSILIDDVCLFGILGMV